MSNPTIRRAISTGPKHTPMSDGSVWVLARPCPECSGAIDEGETITFTPAGWAHDGCIDRVLAEVNAEDAWLLLGSQLARRPSHFNAGEIRVITNNLLRLAAGMPLEYWKPGDRKPIDGPPDELAQRRRSNGAEAASA